jgi:hypothetical protein
LKGLEVWKAMVFVIDFCIVLFQKSEAEGIAAVVERA